MSADAIRAALDGAQELDPAERVRVEVARLAKLDRAGYLAERKLTAKSLGIPVGQLDKLIEEACPAGEAAAHKPLAPLPPELYPEAVEARVVLDALCSFIARFVVVDEHELTALASWIVFTHCFEIAETSPRLAILSPTKRCGKTRLLDLLALLCPSALSASNLTASALFRTIDSEKCTLLIDEADTFTRGNDEFRGLLNSGHTRASAYVIRSVPSGDKEWTPKRFATWAPIAVAAIGRLPDTWIDRSIVISMKRKLRSQKVERLTRRNVRARAEAAELASKLGRFAADNRQALSAATPAVVDALNDRANDNWELLLAIADMAGSAWSQRVRAAAMALSGDREEADDSLSMKLLGDIKTILDTCGCEEIGSVELCDKLKAFETSPWATITRGRPLTPAKLARMLAGFAIHVQKIDGGKARGYGVRDFEDAFEHYLEAIPPDQSVKVSEPLTAVSQTEYSEVSGPDSLKNEETLTETGTSDTLTLSHGGMDAEQVIASSDREDF